MAVRIDLAWIRAGWRRGIGRARRGLAALGGGGLRLIRGGRDAIVQGARRLVRATGERWHRLSAAKRRFFRHLTTNLLIGLAIAVALHHFHASPLLHPFDDAALDWAMRMYRGTAPPAGARPIAFIDIDEASWRNWGEPLITPRDRLAALVRHAADGGAAAIVLDMDLSRPGGAGDAALATALAAWLPDATGAAPALPPLILARTFRLPPPDGPHSLPEERATPFDDLAARAPGVHWGAPLFQQDADGQVRRWNLWTATCGTDGVPLVRASIQLLLAGLLDGDATQRAALTRALEGVVPADCGQADAGSAPGRAAEHREGHGEEAADGHHPAAAGKTRLGAREVHLRPQATAERVVYQIPWHLAEGESRPTVEHDGRAVPVLAVRPAAAVAGATDPASAAWLKGHVAIIGASFQEARDSYMTPIGRMPGALIVANAVQSLGHHGELRTPDLAQTIALEASLILLMSWAFARFDSFLGSLLSALAIILVLLPASLLAFGSGLWLSFAFPLVAILVHKLFAETEDLVDHLTKQGHHHD